MFNFNEWSWNCNFLSGPYSRKEVAIQMLRTQPNQHYGDNEKVQARRMRRECEVLWADPDQTSAPQEPF